MIPLEAFMKRGWAAYAAPVLVCILVSSITAHAADNLVGTWKLNLAKSTYSPGPPPRSIVATFESVKDGIKETHDRVESDGTKIHFEWIAFYDGKDYPVKGDPSRDSGSIRKIDDYTVEITNRKAGKVMTTARITIARDGKSRDSMVTGVDQQGRQVHNTLLWERQ